MPTNELAGQNPRYLVGILLLLVVNIVWIASAEITRVIFDYKFFYWLWTGLDLEGGGGWANALWKGHF